MEDMEESGHKMMTDLPTDTPLTQLDPEDYQPRTVGKRSSHAQAAPVDRMKVGDITFSGVHTPSRPVGKTRLASSSPASSVAIAGVTTSVERAVRHLQLLQVAKEVDAAGLDDGHGAEAEDGTLCQRM